MASGLVLNKTIASSFKAIEKLSDGTLIVTGKFTSDNKDQVGDIITRAATEGALPQYRQWGNIRYMHQMKPVGKVLAIGTEDGLEWNEVRFKVTEPDAVRQVEDELLSALSVGIWMSFDDIDFLEDGGWVINNYTLTEISLVDHPANYDAKLDLSMASQEFLKTARTEGMMTAIKTFGIPKVKDEQPTDDKLQNNQEDKLMAEVNKTLVEEKEVTEAAEEENVEEEIIPEVEEELENKVLQEEIVEEIDDEVPVAEETTDDEPVPIHTLDELFNLVEALTVKFEKAAPQEAPIEQEDSETADEVGLVTREEFDAKMAEILASIEEMKKTGSRKAAVRPTEVVEEEVEEVEETSEEVLDLRAGLTQYLHSTGRPVVK